MAKRIIEIDDTLEETIDSANADLRDRFESFVKENPKLDPREDYESHDDISEIADSQTPVYNSEIDDLWYLYSDRFESAFEDASIYGKNEKPDNYQQVAIYCYIEQQLWEEFARLKDEYGEKWTEAHTCADCGLESEDVSRAGENDDPLCKDCRHSRSAGEN